MQKAKNKLNYYYKIGSGQPPIRRPGYWWGTGADEVTKSGRGKEEERTSELTSITFDGGEFIRSLNNLWD